MFSGKIAVITGAAVGIGRATAVKFAMHGAKLALLDIDQAKLEAVKQELKEYTEDVILFSCDISNENRVFEVINQVLSTYGHIDILVNNAALWRCCILFEETPIDDWKKYFDVNVMGTVYCIRAVLRHMKERKYGRIINVASVAGVYGKANMVHYSATKGAIIAMTKALAKEVAGYDITVNSVSPGTVSDSGNPDWNAYVSTDLCYMHRTGTDMENANLICFLAGDEAGYISGQNILIDGCRKKI